MEIRRIAKDFYLNKKDQLTRLYKYSVKVAYTTALVWAVYQLLETLI